MAAPVTVTFEMRLKPGMGDAIGRGAPAMVEETATRPGFRDIRIVRHKDDPDRILMVETWDSEADYRAYLDWRAAQGSRADKLMASPPEINIWPVTVVRR